MTTTAAEPACPKCGGPVWDNRETKKNPKAPDYKCRGRSCDGVIWPPRNGRAPAIASAKQPISDGGPLPYEVEEETGAPPASGAQAPALRPELVALYKQCVSAAQSIAVQHHIDKLGGDVASAVAAMSATLFIAARGGK